jgi:hypothetical protein
VIIHRYIVAHLVMHSSGSCFVLLLLSWGHVSKGNDASDRYMLIVKNTPLSVSSLQTP